MDIRRNPFPSSFMTAPGGLEYLKMPMGLVQTTPSGELIPAGHHAIAAGHHGANPNGHTHPHMVIAGHAHAVHHSNNARGKTVSTAATTTAHGAPNLSLPDTHYAQAQGQHHRPHTTAVTSYHQSDGHYRAYVNQNVQQHPQQQQQQQPEATHAPRTVASDVRSRDDDSTSRADQVHVLPQSNVASSTTAAAAVTTQNLQIVDQKPLTSPMVAVSSTVVIRDPTVRPKYVCEVCNKGFKSGYNLKRHTNDYHGENSKIVAEKASHMCPLCAKPFLSSHNLKRHTEDFHSENKLTYHCEICRKNFQNRFNLKRHRIGIHSGPGGQFQCEICSKTFHYQSNLTRHRKDEHKSGPGFPGTQVVVHPSHKVVKKQHPALLAIAANPASADPSPASSSAVSAPVSVAEAATPAVVTSVVKADPQELQTTVVHQQQQPQQQQPHSHLQQFQQPQQILVMPQGQLHQVQAIPIAVPQPVPPPSRHVCDLCRKPFTNAYNLKRHKINVHRDTKILYRCDACGKDFPSVANFTRHRNLMHGNGEPAGYRCDTCEKSFASKDGLKRHISAIHGNPAKDALQTVDADAISSSSNLC